MEREFLSVSGGLMDEMDLECSDLLTGERVEEGGE